MFSVCDLKGSRLSGFPFFVNKIIVELKDTFNRRSQRTYYFWHDRSGLEIDFVFDRSGTLIPIEAKSGKTFAGDWIEPIARWRALAGEESGQGWIMYGGDENLLFRDVDIVAWRDINRLFQNIESG
jgi:hypothetical protein